ncbi:hypothetical protein [uncultured Muriicola sp.]|uniref:hypothetical protein n=1 Tax=uncultured Muriicola sp. TaxID=1583102 RepID=UPI0026281A94|nr:hypothetical protein [uncultured Muriicola sp.]
MKDNLCFCLLAILLFLIQLIGIPNSAISSQLFSLTDLGSGNYTFAINNKGKIAGYSTSPSELGNNLFIYEDGNINHLGFIGQSGQPYDINDKGQIVGRSQFNIYEPRAFIYKDNHIQIIDEFKDTDAYASSINNNGQVLINDTSDSYFQKAFILEKNGTVTPLDKLGLRTWANAINDSGHAVGFSTAGGSGSFIYKNGIMEHSLIRYPEIQEPDPIRHRLDWTGGNGR